MESEEIKTILHCVRCQKDCEHIVYYQKGMISSIVCQECGIEIGFDQKKFMAYYGEDLVSRILTKPRRITEEYEKDLIKFMRDIPFRIITKPYRMIKEIDPFKN
ncbi:MAG: bh protein [Candidatus Atribacteria bacterium]|nr:bh protein [Candidatus Atribacteria bacterium]